MDAPEQWITVEDIAAVDFPLVNTRKHQLPAAVAATVDGHVLRAAVDERHGHAVG